MKAPIHDRDGNHLYIYENGEKVELMDGVVGYVEINYPLVACVVRGSVHWPHISGPNTRKIWCESRNQDGTAQGFFLTAGDSSRIAMTRVFVLEGGIASQNPSEMEKTRINSITFSGVKDLLSDPRMIGQQVFVLDIPMMIARLYSEKLPMQLIRLNQ
jgi:hypothetical protein